jgi:GxxExxY protein
MNEPMLLPICEEIETVGQRIIACAITVHRELGPGFKELIYQRAFCLELDEAGLKYEAEKKILVPCTSLAFCVFVSSCLAVGP